MNRRRQTWLERSTAIVCVSLLFLLSFIAAAHFHSGDATGAEHPCSVCALVHAGFVPGELGSPLPIFAPSLLDESPSNVPHSLLVRSAPYIRPPPSL